MFNGTKCFPCPCVSARSLDNGKAKHPLEYQLSPHDRLYQALPAEILDQISFNFLVADASPNQQTTQVTNHRPLSEPRRYRVGLHIELSDNLYLKALKAVLGASHLDPEVSQRPHTSLCLLQDEEKEE